MCIVSQPVTVHPPWEQQPLLQTPGLHRLTSFISSGPSAASSSSRPWCVPSVTPPLDTSSSSSCAAARPMSSGTTSGSAASAPAAASRAPCNQHITHNRPTPVSHLACLETCAHACKPKATPQHAAACAVCGTNYSWLKRAPAGARPPPARSCRQALIPRRHTCVAAASALIRHPVVVSATSVSPYPGLAPAAAPDMASVKMYTSANSWFSTPRAASTMRFVFCGGTCARQQRDSTSTAVC